MDKNSKAIYVVCAILLSLFLILGCQLTVPPTIVDTPARTGTATTSLTDKEGTFSRESEATTTPRARNPTSTPESRPTSVPALIEVPENNELRLYSPDDPETLDPALVQDMTSHRFVRLLFSGLVTLDSELNVVPDLAERWEIDESGTVYTFYLRQDARFHDGKPVTAEDVIYSLDRAADPERGSVKRAQSYLDDIVGVMERTTGETKTISGLKALDDYTVQITIDAPKPYFLAKFTYPTAFVVSKENVEQTRGKWTAHPIGTGPFKMAENGHTQMVLEAFDEYHLGRPKLDRLIFVYRGQTMNLYERGELDVVEIGAEYIDRVLDPNDPLHDDLRIVSQVDVWYIGFDVASPPFDSRHVRRAFAYATNKVAIAEIALNKMVLPAKGILPPGLPGYNPDLEGIPYDPQRALDEIAASEYGDASELPPITLTVTGAENGEMLAEMYKQTLGVEIQVEVVDWSEFLGGLDNRAYQMFSLGWIGDYPDPQNFLDMLFHSQSAYNHSNYSNPDLDALVEQARVEQDTDKRLMLYRQAEQVLVDDAPWIPLYHSGGYYLVRPYVQDLVISAQETMNLHEVSIGAP